MGLVVVCSAVFLAMFIISYIDYVQKLEENQYVEWDVKTITAGDYTIEFKIPDAFYKAYMNQMHTNWI